jgi:hypothetical protein
MRAPSMERGACWFEGCASGLFPGRLVEILSVLTSAILRFAQDDIHESDG